MYFCFVGRLPVVTLVGSGLWLWSLVTNALLLKGILLYFSSVHEQYFFCYLRCSINSRNSCKENTAFTHRSSTTDVQSTSNWFTVCRFFLICAKINLLEVQNHNGFICALCITFFSHTTGSYAMLSATAWPLLQAQQHVEIDLHWKPQNKTKGNFQTMQV